MFENVLLLEDVTTCPCTGKQCRRGVYVTCAATLFATICVVIVASAVGLRHFSTPGTDDAGDFATPFKLDQQNLIGITVGGGGGGLVVGGLLAWFATQQDMDGFYLYTLGTLFGTILVLAVLSFCIFWTTTPFQGISEYGKWATILSVAAVGLFAPGGTGLWLYRKNQEVPCPNGCTELVKRHELKEHKETCGHEMMSCPNTCGGKVKRENLEEHKNTCVNQMVSCPGCERTMRRENLEGHKNTCEELEKAAAEKQAREEEVEAHKSRTRAMVSEFRKLNGEMTNWINSKKTKGEVVSPEVLREYTREHFTGEMGILLDKMVAERDARKLKKEDNNRRLLVARNSNAPFYVFVASFLLLGLLAAWFFRRSLKSRCQARKRRDSFGFLPVAERTSLNACEMNV